HRYAGPSSRPWEVRRAVRRAPSSKRAPTYATRPQESPLSRNTYSAQGGSKSAFMVAACRTAMWSSHFPIKNPEHTKHVQHYVRCSWRCRSTVARNVTDMGIHRYWPDNAPGGPDVVGVRAPGALPPS